MGATTPWGGKSGFGMPFWAQSWAVPMIEEYEIVN